MRPPQAIVGPKSSASAGMSDLQSLLDRIAIEGSSNNPCSVDEVAENLRLRLNLRRSGDNSIFKSIAAQLLELKIDGHVGSEETSPTKAEPELQSTWSTETSSTANSSPGASDSTEAPPPTDTNEPQSLECNLDLNCAGGRENSYGTGEEIRGSSPLGDNQRQHVTDAIPASTPELARVINHAPSSEGWQKQPGAHRSPTLFGVPDRFKRSLQAESLAAGPSHPSSFERVGLFTTSSTLKQTMSPCAPSLDTSFGSSLPPTPKASIFGTQGPAPVHRSQFRFEDSPRSQRPSMPSQAAGGVAYNGTPSSHPIDTGASSNQHDEGPSMSQTNDGLGRGRSRTPSRTNPRIHSPSQMRSKSLPRTMSKSPFRWFSVPVKKETKQWDAVPAKSSCGIAHQDQGYAENFAANEHKKSKAAVPKSSPMKTPPSCMINGEPQVVTGKGKMRRKLTAPKEVVSPNSLGNNGSSTSMEGATATNAFVFKVDLSKQAKRKQRPGGRRSKAQTRTEGASLRTQVPVLIPDEADHCQTMHAEHVLTPMDTDSKPKSEAVTESKFEVPFPAVGAQGATQGVQFSLGDMNSKGGKRTAKNGPRARANRNASRQQAATSASSNTQPLPSRTQAGVDHAMILSQINSIRESAGKYYSNCDYRSSILWYTEAIRMFSTLHREVAPQELLGLLLSNRAAALLMIRATEAAADDCKLAIRHVSPLSLPQSALTADSGPALLAKLYTRMAKAFLKAGKVEQADMAFTHAIGAAEDAMNLCRQVHLAGEFVRDEKILSQMITDATLGKMEVSVYRQTIARINSYKLPLQSDRASLNDRKRAVTVLTEVNTALATAPASVELHEKKIALLSALCRWREIASHCERLAASFVLFDDVFKGDLESKTPFPDTPAAKVLTANFFGDPIGEDFRPANFEAAELKLNSKATAEAVLRLPHSLISTYLRALRLEERYPAADAGIKALEDFVNSNSNTSANNRLCTNFAWLSGEASKLSRTRKGRERGDELFRAGDFNLAAAQYASCLKIDSEGSDERSDSASGNGGRLHAVLHCNRAACLMATKNFDQAVKECTAALRIHSRYMKAMLRRGRCYSRLYRYEESVNEYSKWLGLVDDAKQQGEPSPAYLSACLFDGPQKVSREEYNQVKLELDEARKLKERKEKSAREEASYRHERQKFHDAFTDAQRRRDNWYSQQGSGSRRWDSFTGDGIGGSTKRSPKPRTQQQQSQRQPDFRRGSQTWTDIGNVSPPGGTHYAVLDLPHNATESDIKKAYRKMALKYHPDKNSDPRAPDHFRKVKTAYEVLNDASSRRKYDQELRWGGSHSRRF